MSHRSKLRYRDQNKRIGPRQQGRGEKALAIRTYRECAAELFRRTGIKMSAARAQQICLHAEYKLREALWAYAEERGWL